MVMPHHRYGKSSITPLLEAFCLATEHAIPLTVFGRLGTRA